MNIKFFVKNRLAFFIGILLFSCSSPNAQFISQVESLEKSVLASSRALQEVDTARIASYYRISNENLKFIHEHYTDTMDKETALLISDYSASRKSLKKLLENYADVQREISYSNAQLQSMKTDIENNLMPEDKFTDYFATESKSAEKLSELAQNTVHWYNSALKTYATKSPDVEKIVNGIKTQQAIR